MGKNTFQWPIELIQLFFVQTKEVVDKLGSDSAQPLFNRVLEHMDSKYTSLGKPEEALPHYQRSSRSKKNYMVRTWSTSSLPPMHCNCFNRDESQQLAHI